MNLDIGDILNGWDYEPGKVTVRKIRATDGRDKIQLRLDLGLLQMETSGRPDGTRPHDKESLLAHYEDQLEQHKKERGNDKGFALDEKACELLRTETVMYYHRYLAEFVLEDYDAVVRDTEHNLRLMDLCYEYATEASDRYILEQYRSYVLMMHSRAKAQSALRDHRSKTALAVVQEGIEKIKGFYERFDQEKLSDGSAELSILRAMAKDIEGRIPVDPTAKLQQQLDQAVTEERYEEAAVLRDKIRRTRDEPPPPDEQPAGA